MRRYFSELEPEVGDLVFFVPFSRVRDKDIGIVLHTDIKIYDSIFVNVFWPKKNCVETECIDYLDLIQKLPKE